MAGCRARATRQGTILLQAFCFAALLACFAWSPPARALGPQYVGDEVCTSCHEDLLGPFHETIHSKVLNEKNARTETMKRGCEACHGPGATHVEAGGGRGTGGPDFITFRPDSGESASRQNAVCLTCHKGGRRIYWEGSQHQQRGLSCTSCHHVMRKISAHGMLAKSTQVDTCAQCHLMPRSMIWRNSHMPLRQGPASGRDVGAEDFMQCTSCHNPHGTVTPKLIDANTVNEKCYSCHAEKRGPFLWEHAPVAENCLNCHSPHGSVNPYLLTVAPPRLCQQCHDPQRHPGQPQNPTSRFVIWQSCMNCHPQVHGSNHPAGATLNR